MDKWKGRAENGKRIGAATWFMRFISPRTATLIRIIAMVSLLAVSACVASYVIWFRGWGGYSSYGLHNPKDSDLVAIFQTHRPSFDKLQHMAAEDVRHGRYLGLGEKGNLDESRWQEYQQLISEVQPGLKVVMDGSGDGMRFIFAGGGISAIGPGWVKGIEYVPGDSETNGAIYGELEQNRVTYHQWQGLLSSNLDEASNLPGNVYLRPIEPKWYVFYQRDE